MIRAALDIATPPQRVFASLVEPEQVARWFGWRPDIDPRVGGRISFGLDGEISEFEPGEVLVYGGGAGSIVRWELAGSAGGTHLTFVHSGFGTDELDSAAQHEAGWLGGLAELRRMHELGADWTPVSTGLPAGDERSAAIQRRRERGSYRYPGHHLGTYLVNEVAIGRDVDGRADSLIETALEHHQPDDRLATADIHPHQQVRPGAALMPTPPHLGQHVPERAEPRRSALAPSRCPPSTAYSTFGGPVPPSSTRFLRNLGDGFAATQAQCDLPAHR